MPSFEFKINGFTSQRGDRGFKTRPRGSAQISAERTADRGFSAESDNFTYKTELIINKKNEFLDQIHQVSICNYVELKLPYSSTKFDK